jgi:signal transduction histidine kinase
MPQPVLLLSFNEIGVIQDLDPEVASLLKTTRQAARGISLGKWIVPEDAELFLTHLRSCRSKVSEAVAVLLRFKSGRVVLPMRLISYPYSTPDGLLIRNSLTRVDKVTRPPDEGISASSVLDMLQDPVLVVETDGTITYSNQAFQRLADLNRSRARLFSDSHFLASSGSGFLQRSLFRLGTIRWREEHKLETLIERASTSSFPLVEVLHCTLTQKGKIQSFKITARRIGPASDDRRVAVHLQNLTTRVEAELEREKAFWQLRSAAFDLEKLIEDRTRELASSNARLKRLSTALIQTQESEKKKLSLELHDQVGQSLTALKLMLNSLGQKLSPEKQDEFNQIQNTVSSLMQQIRKMSFDLRPHVIDDLGLVAGLRWQAGELSKISGMNIAVEAKRFKIEEFPKEIAITFYRIFQEAMTNILRHSKATRTKVILRTTAKFGELAIEDNGIGFTAVPGHAGLGRGLAGMRERLELLDGNLTVQSGQGKGTIVRARVPLSG